MNSGKDLIAGGSGVVIFKKVRKMVYGAVSCSERAAEQQKLAPILLEPEQEQFFFLNTSKSKFRF